MFILKYATSSNWAGRIFFAHTLPFSLSLPR